MTSAHKNRLPHLLAGTCLVLSPAKI